MREGKSLFHIDLNENLDVLEAWKADKPQNIDRKWKSANGWLTNNGF